MPIIIMYLMEMPQLYTKFTRKTSISSYRMSRNNENHGTSVLARLGEVSSNRQKVENSNITNITIFSINRFDQCRCTL